MVKLFSFANNFKSFGGAVSVLKSEYSTSNGGSVQGDVKFGTG